ncbi:MAG: hypothetical protein ACLFWF_01525 [Alphaproteobacteria bacterium]
MAHPEWVESVKPWKNLLIGIGIPVAAITGCAAAGMLLASVLHGQDGKAQMAGAYFGALIGFFASFYGLAELLIAFFFSGGPALNRICRAAGYVSVWASAAAVILYFR